MAENLMKVPPKGILKNSTSFEGSSSTKCSSNRGTKWDEMNILATHHPPDKDYGHMKIEEPKTPYSYQGEGSEDEEESHNLDEQLLAERLMAGGEKLSFVHKQASGDGSDDDDDNDEDETPEAKAKRKSFEFKRKAHYNEFMAVKLARQLMQKDEEVDSDAGDDDQNLQLKVSSDQKSIEQDLIEDMDTKEATVETTVEESSANVSNTMQS